MSMYNMCPNCGRRMRRDKDILGYWDGETYICDYCYEDDYDEPDNAYCRACGNSDEWPDCKSYCGKMEDD